MEDLLGIGEFAALAGLSPKMLRSYARAGFLVPAAVDGSTGYRYYSRTQLPQARVVALLRQAEIGVEEIATFLAEPDEAQVTLWEREITSEASSRREALAAARDALGMDRPGPSQWRRVVKEEPLSYQFEAGLSTETGGRETNEDNALVAKDLWAVADGLGGLGNGEVASRQALEVLDEAFGSDRTAAGLLGACKAANHAVWQEGAERSADTAMGTTLVALALTSDLGAVLVSVGDSRLYRLRSGRLVQLTKDHTVPADLVEAGELGPDEVETHPHRHVLTRALGVSDAVDVDHAGVSCEEGDRFLLCTDGLFRSLTSDELKSVLGSEEPPHAAAARLVSTAVGCAADDNVTALVIRVA